ncbi:MAG TPA: carboxypeptidase-like regulatory domain-containing protein [Methanocella sp.]|jgi:hypothetical protein
MSRSVIALPALLALAVFLVMAPGVLAEENQTSSVMLVGSSTTFTVEDANRSEINYSAYDSIYGTSVHVSVITAQLFLNGQPYHQANIPITFTSDNDTIAVLEPYNRTRPSDANGSAKILLIANNTVGYVNITATVNPQFFERSDTCTVRVVGWGTVSGVVTDKNKNGVPYAKVTLWIWNGTDNVGILRSPDNPQLTVAESTIAAPGTYTFTYVPAGVYNLTAEKDNHTYFAMVYLTVGTYTANVAFPDYVYPAYIPPTVTPTPVPTATPVPTPTPTPTPKPSPGFEVFGVIAAMGFLALAVKKQGRR